MKILEPRRRFWFCSVLVGLVVVGCAVKTDLKTNLAIRPPQSHLIKSIPFVQQKPFYCAPASAEMVLRFYGITKFKQDQIALCDVENARGTSWRRLVGWLKKNGQNNGFTVFSGFGNLHLLKQYIALDKPVIVKQWTNLKKKSKHYRVVAGYDDRTKQITCWDPHKGPNFKIGYVDFMELWDIEPINSPVATENLMIVISPKDTKDTR